MQRGNEWVCGDLYGNEAMTASQRVDAWASTWRVRQFQQIGGAPVTITPSSSSLRAMATMSCCASLCVGGAASGVGREEKAGLHKGKRK